MMMRGMTAKDFDPIRYSGRWFEVASLKRGFAGQGQEDCHCTQVNKCQGQVLYLTCNEVNVIICQITASQVETGDCFLITFYSLQKSFDHLNFKQMKPYGGGYNVSMFGLFRPIRYLKLVATPCGKN